MLKVNEISFDIVESRLWAFLDTHRNASHSDPAFMLDVTAEAKAVSLDDITLQLRPVIHARFPGSGNDWRCLTAVAFNDEFTGPEKSFTAWCVQPQIEEMESYEFRIMERSKTEFTIEFNATAKIFLDEAGYSVHYYGLISVPFVAVFVAVSRQSLDPAQGARIALAPHLDLCAFSTSIVHTRSLPGKGTLAYEVEFCPVQEAL